MSAAWDLQVLENWLLSRFASATCVKHVVPEEPASHQFSLSFKKEERFAELVTAMRTQRQYEVGYWHHNPEEVLAVMEELAVEWYENNGVRLPSGDYAMRLVSFTYAPFQGTATLYGCVGTLTVERRYQRVQEPVVKMAKVEAAFQ